MSRVAANVTGANRLLIGLGWSLVILIYFFKRRKPLDLRGYLSLEMTMLGIATLASFLIFFMEEVHMVLAGLLIALYVFYLWATSIQEAEEPELIGASLLIGSLPVTQRRVTVVGMFLFSAAVILMAAEPFVESLIETGEELGIDEFILIQWIAPLASESPEIIIAMLFSLRANPVAGITTLISSEVNQLTVLIGSMVVIFSMSVGEPLSFALESRQAVEFLLTSAVSLFAILLIAPRSISWQGGLVLLGLFILHLFFVDEGERLIFTFIYLGLAGLLVVLDRSRVVKVFSRQT
jgi:cation:H+ antiporter